VITMVQQLSKHLVFPKPICFMVGGPDVDSRLELMQQLSNEFELTMAGSDDSLKERFHRAGFAYWSYNLNRGASPLHDLKMVFDLMRIFRKIRPAIVHTFDTKPGVFARLAAWLAGVPIIIGTLPGLGSLYSENDLRTRLIRSIYQPLQKLACGLSDLTIFQNPDDAAQFVKIGIVEKNNITILPGSGVDTQAFDPRMFSPEQKRKIRASLGLDEDQVVITMVSRLIRQKGVLEYARVARHIKKHYPQSAFLLVGSNDGESESTLTPSEREQIINSVLCLGMRKDIPGLLAITDVFVLPTYYREGIPRVLLEAASMGLPLVATSVPGCTEVVEQAANGFLVPARDGEALECRVETLIVNSDLRKQFGKVSRQRAVDFFDLSIVAEQTTEIYKQLLAKKFYGR